MNSSKTSGLARGLLSLGLVALLSGCNWGVLDPKGQVGIAQKELLIICTLLMLIVVIPVIVLTIVFAWKYRESNTSAEYLPNWSHSNKIETFVWGVPLVIVAILAVLTWRSSHSLDPYRPLESNVKPVTIQAISMDWKWLFIYPDEGVATINEVAFPINTPVNFELTSDTVMNAFFIPQLGSMIYSMAGMETKLHLDAHETGDYFGLSSHYSGAGYAGMTFTAKAVTGDDYQAWLAKAKASPLQLDPAQYRDLSLLRNDKKAPVTYFSSVTPDLFKHVIHKYMNPTAKDREVALAMNTICRAGE
ncbi:MAG: Cytochrome bo(3) ubiquinol oxidase subunit 2 [Paracidovorax wautersii]|uniref:Ubiquinol oxidase subunit 2 n=1 Tax=Paracidovorax wautersii TaxID=1177982 RepID=A0A7V8FMV1_9BURK|nr:MAG: Cytochrome bo(3) ubiquinol oxidase subunit 2 [Paracidovorax wautersii]